MNYSFGKQCNMNTKIIAIVLHKWGCFHKQGANHILILDKDADTNVFPFQPNQLYAKLITFMI